jgi:hypothetical protein
MNCLDVMNKCDEKTNKKTKHVNYCNIVVRENQLIEKNLNCLFFLIYDEKIQQESVSKRNVDDSTHN